MKTGPRASLVSRRWGAREPPQRLCVLPWRPSVRHRCGPVCCGRPWLGWEQAIHAQLPFTCGSLFSSLVPASFRYLAVMRREAHASRLTSFPIARPTVGRPFRPTVLSSASSAPVPPQWVLPCRSAFVRPTSPSRAGVAAEALRPPLRFARLCSSPACARRPPAPPAPRTRSGGGGGSQSSV